MDAGVPPTSRDVDYKKTEANGEAPAIIPVRFGEVAGAKHAGGCRSRRGGTGRYELRHRFACVVPLEKPLLNRRYSGRCPIGARSEWLATREGWVRRPCIRGIAARSQSSESPDLHRKIGPYFLLINYRSSTRYPTSPAKANGTYWHNPATFLDGRIDTYRHLLALLASKKYWHTETGRGGNRDFNSGIFYLPIVPLLPIAFRPRAQGV